MFNPCSLPVYVSGSHSSNEAFVGVRKNNIGQAEFCIPLGFNDFPIDDPRAVNRLFFDIYKILRKFSTVRNFQSNKSFRSQDGNISAHSGNSFVDEEGETVTLYSKIPMLEAIIESYDDLNISLLLDYDSKTTEVAYARIDKYLANAVYLKDNTAFIDEIVVPKNVLLYDMSDLVRMYCYIFSEVKRAIDEEVMLSHELIENANIFKSQHLKSDSELFDKDVHDDTVELLKEILAEIHKQVSYKNNDYWAFFDVIEVFLYGEIGEEPGLQWGISKFSAVWEAMCIAWCFEQVKDTIVFADTNEYSNKRIGGFDVYISKTFDSPFYFECAGKRRYLRPDLVHKYKESFMNERFDKVFKIEEVGHREYKVRVNQKDKHSKIWFQHLVNTLIPSGMSRPKITVEQHIFRFIEPSNLQKSVTKIKHLMLGRSNSSQVTDYRIADFKYVPSSIYSDDVLCQKALSDVKKQLVYEFAFRSNISDMTVSSQFCVPRYYKHRLDAAGRPVNRSALNKIIQQKNIQVLEVDFVQVKNAYLQNGENR